MTRVAIVGTGFSAGAHVDALRRLPGIEVVLVGRTVERAREAAARLGVTQVIGSVEELLAGDDVRAVHNCTPNDVHAEINVALLQAGRHVLSEKPLGRTGAEGLALAALAARTDAVSGVCFNYRHFPLVQEARAQLRSGRLGGVHLVHGSYLQDWLLYPTDWSWRLDPERNGASRAVADIGSHWMDLAQHVTGERIVEVCADLGTVHETRIRPQDGTLETFGAATGEGTPFPVDTEDFASVLVRFESGARGSFTVSQVSAGHKNRLLLEVDAAEEALAWDQSDPGKLWIGHRGRANEILTRDPGLLGPEAAPLAHLPGGHEEGWADALHNLVADFHAAVAAHEAGAPYAPTFATFADGAQLCALVDAILESHATRAWTPLAAAARVSP